LIPPGLGGITPDLDAALLLDSLSDAVLVVDTAGRIVWANRAAVTLFCYPAGELLGAAVETLVPDELGPSHAELRQAYQAHPSARPMGPDRRLEAITADGDRLVVEISLSPFELSTGPVVLAVVRDVGEWARAEVELRESVEHRRLLEDRERIARDLHDTVIQRLFATGMSLQAVIADAEPPPVMARISQAIDELDVTIREIREVIFALHHDQSNRPSEQMRLLVESMEIPLGFRPGLVGADALDALDRRIVEHVFPVVREALSNVARHAEATEAQVVVHTDGELRVVVTDNGIGVGPEQDRPRGTGLVSLGRRAALYGGALTVRSASPGTMLEWWVPI
jgi:PAS domain S-box-containing protein